MRAGKLHAGVTAHTLVDGTRYMVTVEGMSTDRKHWVVVTPGGVRLNRKARELQSPESVASEIALAETLKLGAQDQENRQIRGGYRRVHLEHVRR